MLVSGACARAVLVTALSFGFVAAIGSQAIAAPDTSSNDAEVEILVQSVFESEFPNKKYVEALENLQLAANVCQEGGCSAKTRAKVLVGVATVLAGGLDQKQDAIEVFRIALKEDSKVGLLKGFNKGAILEAWEAARGGKPAGPEAEPRKKYPGGQRAPKGWKTAEAHFYYEEALKAQSDKKWLVCAGYAGDSLAAEERIGTKFLRAQCLDKGQDWKAALPDYEVVAREAPGLGMLDVGKVARARVALISEKMPKISLRQPPNVEGLVVSIDDVEIPADGLGSEITLNPGARRVKASGKVNNQALIFDREFNLKEGDSQSIEIQLVPQTSVARDNRVLKCLEKSKSREELAACIGEGTGRAVNVNVAVEFSGYHDSDETDVLSPAIAISVVSPTDGWSVGGSFLVDVVSTASTDIIATASPRWTETRYVPALNGSKKFGDVTVGLGVGGSIEPDYISAAAGLNGAIDLFDKRVTASLAYGFGYDIQGRSGTSFDAFSTVIIQNSLDAGVSIVADKSTVVSIGLTSIFQVGDTSKPYRYVPLFDESIVGAIPPGLVIEEVNRVRSQTRALEQLPTERYRFAASGRVAHRFDKPSSTLRFDERLYIDTWGLKASTSDFKLIFDVDRTRVWPHVRFHAQSAADFWQLAYPVREEGGEIVLPNLRTGDRELGPLISAYLGGGVRLELGEKKNWGLELSGDFIYTRYLDHLYIIERFGGFGAIGAEVDIE